MSNDPVPHAACFSLLTEVSALRQSDISVTDKLQATTVTEVDCALQMNRPGTLDTRDTKAGQSLINLQRGTCLQGAQLTHHNSECTTATVSKKMHRNQPALAVHHHNPT